MCFYIRKTPVLITTGDRVTVYNPTTPELAEFGERGYYEDYVCKSHNKMTAFIREVKCYRRLGNTCPNITTCYATSTPKRTLLLEACMCDLFTTLERNATVDELFWKCARDITAALRYCHEHSIVHGDVKLENVGIGVGGTIKLFDFDRGYVVRSGERYVRSYKMWGTPKYTPPETIGVKYVPINNIFMVDYWQLGILLYAIAYKTYPFTTQHDILYNEPRFPPTISHVKRMILKGLLNKNPTSRLNLDMP